MNTSDKKKKRPTLYRSIDGAIWSMEEQASNVQSITRKPTKTDEFPTPTNRQTTMGKGKQGAPLYHSPPRINILLKRREQLTKKLIKLRGKPDVRIKFRPIPIINTQDGQFGIPVIPIESHTPTEYEYKESDILTNIDGYVVTDGEIIQVIVSAHLSNLEKQRGVSEMLKYTEAKKPAVYIWHSSDKDSH
jgi:hypothetical protein